MKSTINAIDNVFLGERLSVDGITNLGDKLSITGATHIEDLLSVKSTINAIDNVFLGERLSVDGIVNLGDKLSITGATHIEDLLSVKSTINAIDNVFLGERLSVDGIVNIDDQLFINSTNQYVQSWRRTSHGNWLVKLLNNKLIFYEDGDSDYFALDSNGNLGLGTVTPLSKIDLTTSGGNIRMGGIAPTDNGGDCWIGKQYSSNSTFYSGVLFGNNNNLGDYISFKTHYSGVSAAERMRITGKGEVGIGTTSPSSLFHIEDTSSSNTTGQLIGKAGQITNFKIGRGTGNYSNNQNNLFGFIITDNGMSISKFTAKGSNTTGRADRITIDNSGNVSIAEDTILKGTLSITGATHIEDLLSVKSTLNVTDNVFLNNRISVNGITNLGNKLSITGATHIEDLLSVKSTVNVTDNVFLSNRLSVNNVNVTSNLLFKDNVVLTQLSSITSIAKLANDATTANIISKVNSLIDLLEDHNILSVS